MYVTSSVNIRIFFASYEFVCLAPKYKCWMQILLKCYLKRIHIRQCIYKSTHCLFLFVSMSFHFYFSVVFDSRDKMYKIYVGKHFLKTIAKGKTEKHSFICMLAKFIKCKA